MIVRPFLSHSSSFSSETEKDTAGCRAFHRIFIVGGVDIPEVNTVLFLRPTESLTIFLQQLGRGLRLAEGKECLTVLDFIGQANKRYNFEDKFAALLSNTSRGVTREIKDGFVSAPRGCYIQLEKKAAKYILDNIRASYGTQQGWFPVWPVLRRKRSGADVDQFLGVLSSEPTDDLQIFYFFPTLCPCGCNG